MTPITVAYISKYSYPVKTGGAEISNKLLIDNLPQGSIIQLFENHRFDHITPFPLRKFISYFSMLHELRGSDVDVIVVTQTNWSSLHGVLLSRLLGAKLIINECGDYWRQPESYKRAVGKHVLHLCHGITTRTQFLKNYILQFHPELESKIRVIPNSIDLNEFSYEPFDSETFNFSFFGRLTSAKDPFKLLEIAEILRTRGVTFPFKFEIYGKGNMEDDLRKEIHKKDLDDLINLMGVVHHTEVKDVITKSHLVVMPSTWEPQGRVILESFACGRPILASGVGGMIEALKPDYPFICGSNAEIYADHIIRLVEDTEYYIKICQQNLKRSNEFDIRKNARIFYDYFKEIVDG